MLDTLRGRLEQSFEEWPVLQEQEKWEVAGVWRGQGMPVIGTRMNGGRRQCSGAVIVEVQTGRGELSQRGRSAPNYNRL